MIINFNFTIFAAAAGCRGLLCGKSKCLLFVFYTGACETTVAKWTTRLLFFLTLRSLLYADSSAFRISLIIVISNHWSLLYINLLLVLTI